MPTITYNFEPTDEVYIIDYCEDKNVEAVVKGTIYRVDFSVTTKAVDAEAPSLTSKYILRTSYNENLTIEDESLIFADKAAAFEALETRTA